MTEATEPAADAQRVRRTKRTRLYDSDGVPADDFNRKVLGWLRGDIVVVEHRTPAAFGHLRQAFDLELQKLRERNPEADLRQLTKILLSGLTELMYGNDLSGLLTERLSAKSINPTGFRSALAQGVAKNTGENFINTLAYGVAQVLEDCDTVLVDKGLPPPLRSFLTLGRNFAGTEAVREITMAIESDVAIWHRDNPTRAIIVSAKTRLKEVFHIATMWKLLFDCIGDNYCLEKWGLTGYSGPLNYLIVFATADMIPAGGAKTQGPDVEKEEVRNLIAMDASFMDYVFVSKTGIGHVSKSLNIMGGREALFHELGCIVDLVDQFLLPD